MHISHISPSLPMGIWIVTGPKPTTQLCLGEFHDGEPLACGLGVLVCRESKGLRVLGFRGSEFRVSGFGAQV